MNIESFLFAFLAAMAAGFINAVAGGGTLVTFPVLTAIGLPMVDANVTNTVALSPGLLSGAYAQRKDFLHQKKRLISLLPVAVLGGVSGGLLLLYTSEDSFRIAVPFLILLATLLLAFQPKIKNWIAKTRIQEVATNGNLSFTLYASLFFAAVYGGYFGAGLGIILMAVLGLLLPDNLTKLNVLKQALSFSVNMTAAIYFCFSGKVHWLVALVMMFGSISGGYIGGKVASKLNAEILRKVVIAIGTIVATIYFLKLL